METKDLSAGIISLGCDKNRVDTERMLQILSDAGYTITPFLSDADFIVINTCAFIEKARKEAVNAVFRAQSFRQGKCKKIIMTGCLPKKHAHEMFDDFVEVDAFLGTNSYELLPSVLEKLFESGERALVLKETDGVSIKRIQSTPLHYAYLKIADGCFNACSFCTIPQIRGKYRSRDMQSLIDEAKYLADGGVRELVLVAQDTTSYGIDLKIDDGLPKLIEALSKIKSIDWIRLLYCYPERISQALIDQIAHNDKVAKYIDIPFQHGDDEILKSMRRKINRDGQLKLIAKLRAANNDIAIRSTFMVGYPTESDQQFENLLSFIDSAELDHMGFFAYSREQGTLAYDLKPQISASVKRARLKQAELRAQRIMSARLNRHIGKTMKVLYEDIDYKKRKFVGRTEFNAPEIDGKVFFKGDFASVGQFYNVLITKVQGLDLVGIIDESEEY